MILVYQFFNKPVPNSSIIVPMACEMLPCHFVSIIVHEMLKKMPQKTLQDQTTLYMAVKEKYHEHTKAHLCNSQFGPRRRKVDHIIAKQGHTGRGKLGHSCKKGGQQQKLFCFYDFFCGTHF